MVSVWFSGSSDSDLTGLEVLEEDVALLRLLTPVLDDTARAVDDLAGVTLTVENTCSIQSVKMVHGFRRMW